MDLNYYKSVHLSVRARELYMQSHSRKVESICGLGGSSFKITVIITLLAKCNFIFTLAGHNAFVTDRNYDKARARSRIH